MFDRMVKTGLVDDTAGLRISASGKRFEIREATIWTVLDSLGEKRGEAATFQQSEYL